MYHKTAQRLQRPGAAAAAAPVRQALRAPRTAGAAAAQQQLHRRRSARPAATPAAGMVELEPPFTPEQQFYIAAATIWREKMRDEALQTQIDSGVHSPSSVRAGLSAIVRRADRAGWSAAHG